MSLYPSPPLALTTPQASSAPLAGYQSSSSSTSAVHIDAFAAALSRQRSASGSDALTPPRAKRAKSSDRSAATSASVILGEWRAACQDTNMSSNYTSTQYAPRQHITRSSTTSTNCLPTVSHFTSSDVSAPVSGSSFLSHVANVAQPITFRSSTAPLHASSGVATSAKSNLEQLQVNGHEHVVAGFAGTLGPQLECRTSGSGAQIVEAPSVVHAPKLSATSTVPHIATKDRFVAGLVGASVLAIESIWGSSPVDATSTEAGVLPIQWFVKEVLRRSRTSCSTLQLALYYLHKSRRDIRDAVARADASREECSKLEQKIKADRDAAQKLDDSYPSPPMSPISDAGTLSSTELIQDRLASLLECQTSPILCGRRMFLAALIAASKYLQDRNYSNRAWSRISGLPVNEINSNERAFLTLVGFDLHLGAAEFRKWTERLASLTTQGAQVEQAVSQTRINLGLARTQSEYAPNVEQPTQDLMRSSLTRLPLTVTGRSQSESTLRFTSSNAIDAKTQLHGANHIASPPNSESSGDDDDLCDATLTHASVIAGRKVRGLPLRRSQQSGLVLSRTTSQASLGLSRQAAESQTAPARWH
ncbi:PHO85 cyclin-5 [Microbotryomycetes sp. JL221]|nr:PHO85 cyclin-5 [Microbotryomycetes sp. JL221]